MLYLFDITKFPSNWMHLDMGLTAASVQTLKEHIQEKYKINVDDQVLLISGGVCLDVSKIVCHYSAGTDSNPIYFFNKKVDKNFSFPECPDVTSTTDDLSKLYKKLAKVTPSFQAVTDRASLAEKMALSARSIMEHCEEIIRDHHVANQGWLAAVANYDDVVSNCLRHYEETQMKFEDYSKVRDYFLRFLEKFKEKLPLFKKIPILQKLLKPHDSENRLLLVSETSEGLGETDILEDTNTSFFDWVGEDEHGNNIDTIHKNCEEEIEYYKEDSFNISFSLVPQTLAAASSSNKEINVSFWLSHLDELINKAKGIVEEQNKISSSIQLNLARMKDCKDLSILPHLCETHEQELQVMNENHSILKDIENTCIKAKYEFTLNVQSRISWIVHIENELQRIGVQLDIFSESLERLKYQIDILEKIDSAPTAYFACIAETVRRRSFSQAFLMWASEMACRLHTMHNEEVGRRKDFLTKYEDTFIQMLFPGLDDLPPSYGTKAPSYFDTSLPKLTTEDIDFLKTALPDLPKELTECLGSQDSSNLSYYLSFKSILHTQSDKVEEEMQMDNLLEKLENQNADAEKTPIKEGIGETSLTAIHGLPHLRDIDRGCESETDTEEFEKVGQSPLELNFNKEVASQKPASQDVSTSTEVGERNMIPPQKPPRTFQKLLNNQAISSKGIHCQHNMNNSGTQSNTESFINVKNPSIDSIDEFSILKNFSYNTDNESCFHSNYQYPTGSSSHLKPLSPHTPLSPKDLTVESLKSSNAGHQTTDFINDEFYIDESLPSSLSIETGQSQSEFDKQLDTANSVVALLQENLEICRNEYADLRSTLHQICTIAFGSINQIKTDLQEFKRDYNISKGEILNFIKTIISMYEKLCEEQKSQEQSVVLRLTTEHTNEIGDFRRLAQVKNEEIKSLRTNLSFLENKLKKICEDADAEKNMADIYKQKIERLTTVVSLLEKDKEKSLKELSERLNREHADKMKTLQSRFRLMTMERTSSESSLEKALEFSSSSNHQSVYIQMQENFELQKETFMRQTLLSETEKWRNIIVELEQKFENEKKTLLESIEKRKDEKIKNLEEREMQHLEEIEQYTNKIHELNAIIDAKSKINQQNVGSDNDKEIDLGASVNDRSVSIFELQKEKTETVAMLGTYSEGKVDCATSPIKQRRSISKTLNILGKSSKPNVDAMKPGDCLVIVWDEEYQNFRVVQNGPVIYFLHLDCVHSLGLEILDCSPKRPNKLYCLGEYVEKEYCYARKSENRFNVPQGTRFFRVTVRPLQEEKTCPPPSNLQCIEPSSSFQQRSSSISIAEMDFPPLPPLPKWKCRPDQLPPETFGTIRDSMSEVSNSSDNKYEDSNSSLPFHTANYDINDQHDPPVPHGGRMPFNVANVATCHMKLL